MDQIQYPKYGLMLHTKSIQKVEGGTSSRWRDLGKDARVSEEISLLSIGREPIVE